MPDKTVVANLLIVHLHDEALWGKRTDGIDHSGPSHTYAVAGSSPAARLPDLSHGHRRMYYT